MRTRPGQAIVALLLVLLAACDDGPRLQPLPSDAVILAFGDSLTYGTGAVQASYPAQLARRLQRTVINAGVPGELSAQGAARLPAVLAEYRPRLVILVHGGNDFLRRMPAEATRAHLVQMITSARSGGAEVVLLGVPGPNLTLSAPELYEDVAAELDVPLDADILPQLMRAREFKSDSVHFNGAGYGRMAAAVEQLLIEHGALP